jgi:hypothetical protein
MDVELLLHVYKPDRLEALVAVTMATSLATHYYSALVPGNGTIHSVSQGLVVCIYNLHHIVVACKM